MAITILDPLREAELRKLWPWIDGDRATEVWEGVTVMSPLANNSHQSIVHGLGGVLFAVVTQPRLGQVFEGVNLSDRTPDWVDNYRNPDVVVFLNGTTAVNYGTHFVGGPDFVAEVISPGETPTAKFGFYEALGTKEVLVVHRDPWKLELFTLAAGRLTLAGASELAAPAVLASAALGLTFQLVPGPARPELAVTHPASGGAWSI